MLKSTALLLLLFVGFGINSVFGQEQFRVEGKVVNFSTKASLQDVNIYIQELNKGTSSDASGNFQFKNLSNGTYTFILTYIGFEEYQEEITIDKNTELYFQLTPATESLEEIVITENTQKSRRELTSSVNQLDAETIKKIPTVLGEKDVIKSMLLLPGVTGGGEASGGFHVRGGAADQNLVLLDDAILFNESHLFGFFSVFNPDAVSKLQLYKGGIPSEFGGRASSVLEIYQRNGNLQKFKTNGGIGLVSSRILVEGPIEKNKSSFLVAGRTSYAHLFLKLIDNPNIAYFYDLNTKLNFQLNENNSLSFSGYYGRDVFNINETFQNTYGNSLANLEWKHTFNENISADLSLIYSSYIYDLTIDLIGFKWKSGIDNLNMKYAISHQLQPDFSLDYGLQSIYYTFNPGLIEPSRNSSGFETTQFTKKYAFENSVFIQANQEVGDFFFNYGMRLNQFLRMGQDNINRYANNQPLTFNEQFQIYEEAPIVDTYSASRGEVLKAFYNLEPRAAVSYALNKDELIKVNYQFINQYIHLLSNSNSPTPLDIYTPSGDFIDPQQAHQISFGYANNSIFKDFSLETEVFYKTIDNRIDYVDGAQLIANDAFEQVILNGESRAYGLEFLLRKNKGSFTGWLAYTFSRSEQKTEGRTPEETGINNGDWYSTPWDKPHDISLVGNYDLNDKWSFSANFVYQTGRPVTFPNSFYVYNNLAVPNYAERNANRLPAYHHLDISATLTPRKNKNRRWQAEWVFSIYNVYNRKNAASISFGQNDDTNRNEATRLAIFGIIPSVSYNFKF